MAPFLGLIAHQDSDSTQTGVAMLKAWKEKHGPAATYGKLADTFRQYGRQDLVERVSQLLHVAIDRRETRSSIGEECFTECCMHDHLYMYYSRELSVLYMWLLASHWTDIIMPLLNAFKRISIFSNVSVTIIMNDRKRTN